jgi:hypothetical protein
MDTMHKGDKDGDDGDNNNNNNLTKSNLFDIVCPPVSTCIFSPTSAV